MAKLFLTREGLKAAMAKTRYTPTNQMERILKLIASAQVELAHGKEFELPVIKLALHKSSFDFDRAAKMLGL